MPVFEYTALDSASRRVRGVIRADSSRQARSILFSKGIRATRMELGERETETSRRSPILQLIRRLIALRQRDQVLDAFENLLTLLESHVPLEEAWDSLVQSPPSRKGKFRRRRARIPAVLLQLHEGVRLGRSMWSTMEAFPQHFDAADVALVRAGEEAGELPAALGRFVARRQMAGKLLSTFLAALAYRRSRDVEKKRPIRLCWRNWIWSQVSKAM